MQDAFDLIHVREGEIVLDFQGLPPYLQHRSKKQVDGFPRREISNLGSAKGALISRILAEEFTARARSHTDASQYVLSVTLGCRRIVAVRHEGLARQKGTTLRPESLQSDT